MENSKIANISRELFIGGISVTTVLILAATLVSINSKNLTEEGKKKRNILWYIVGSTALITIASGFIGTKAYGKIK